MCLGWSTHPRDLGSLQLEHCSKAVPPSPWHRLKTHFFTKDMVKVTESTSTEDVKTRLIQGLDEVLRLSLKKIRTSQVRDSMKLKWCRVLTSCVVAWCKIRELEISSDLEERVQKLEEVIK